jgi:hypothetical protein
MPSKKSASANRPLSTSNEPYGVTTRVAPVRARAVYDASTPEPWIASPCLAALTPQRSSDDVTEILTRRPDLSWLASDASVARRRAALDFGRDHFMCTSRSLDVNDALQSLLRAGYLLRQSPDQNWHKDAATRRKEMLRRLRDGDPQPVEAISIGGCLLGPPGSGKSSTVRALLAASPQVIVHELSEFERGTLEQVVFAVVSAPSNGSMKSFCLRFLREIDRVLGTTHSKVTRPNKDDLIQIMGDVASATTLGLLVLDHSENLVTKDGFAEEIIFDLTAIVDTLHIPLFFVGTPETRPLWEASLSLGRRAATHSFEWQPMELDEEWDEYVEHLLLLQVLSEPMSFTREFADALWQASQGVIDVANALYFKVQWFALKDKQPSMSIELLNDVAEHEMPTIMAAIERMRRFRATEGDADDNRKT